MNLSMKWLNDYVKIDVPPREFAHRMTMSGSKVEGYEIEGEEISNVVVGKILSVEKHPDADKLVVCMIDVGKNEPIQIVTGASNVFAGALVPVALDGSVLPGGVKIKKENFAALKATGCSVLLMSSTLRFTIFLMRLKMEFSSLKKTAKSARISILQLVSTIPR